MKHQRSLMHIFGPEVYIKQVSGSRPLLKRRRKVEIVFFSFFLLISPALLFRGIHCSQKEGIRFFVGGDRAFNKFGRMAPAEYQKNRQILVYSNNV
jgi:hypothetical protein